MPVSEALLEAIAVAVELTGTQMSKAAARVMAQDLARYPDPQVLGALTRCRRELKGRLTIGDVLTRLDDGRLGPEEAWAMIPKDERTTFAWTDEMAEAYGVAAPLIAEGDNVQARMAFLECYRAHVQRNRDDGRPVRWTASLGHDVNGRERVLLEAVKLGRLSGDYVAKLLPYRQSAPAEVVALLPDMSPQAPRRSLKAALAEAKEGKAA